jgi:penicillin-binding protein 1A
MAGREGRKRAQDSRSGASLDLRLTPADRTGGPVKGRADTDRRRRDSSPPREPKKRKRGSGKGRSGFGRIFYWGFVLALWGLIAGIGALVWIGIHLPPIESLLKPKSTP